MHKVTTGKGYYWAKLWITRYRFKSCV